MQRNQFIEIKYTRLVIYFSCFICFWLVYTFYPFQSYWLGLSDGYFYGSFIKTFLYQYKLSALDIDYPVQYFPYFFYLLALTGRIFHIANVGQLQYIGFFLVYTLSPLIAYFSLRLCCARQTAFVATSLFYIVTLNGVDGLISGQKPHEIMGLLVIFPLMNYIAHLTNAKPLTRLQKISQSCLYGLTVGSYTVYAIIPTLVTLCLTAKWLLEKKIAFKKVFDGYLILPAIAILAPYLLSTLQGVIKYHISPMTPFLGNSYNYAEILTKECCQYLIALGIALYIFLPKNKLIPNRNICLLLSFSILASLIWLCLMYLLKFYDIYFIEPTRYSFSIPLFGLLLAVISLFEKVKFKQTTINVIFILSIISFPVLFNRIIFDYSSRYNNTIAMKRAIFLNDDIKSLNLYFKEIKPQSVYYLGSREHRFLSYYVNFPLMNFIIFNGSYASAYYNFLERSRNLQLAIHKGGEDFYRFLLDNNIRFLFLEKTTDNFYQIEFTYNTKYAVAIPAKIVIPVNIIVQLITAQRLINFSQSSQAFLLYVR
jgi:hypothetical protein